MWSLSFGATNSSFIVLPLLKCTCMPNFFPMFLKLSLSPLLYGTVMEVLLLLLLLLVLLLFLFCFWLFFFSIILCMAQEGYLHAVSALSTYFNSSFSCSWLEQMLVALCNKELITLYLLAMEWWLSHCRYWFVWVGFLYMEVDKLPSSWTVTRVSRKGNENTRADGSLRFLDTLVTVQEDGSLSTSINRKPTHTNQYLQWDSHHSIANKYRVINSLLHRATNICSNQEQEKEELKYVERALTACKYPSWAIQRMMLKKNNQKQNRNNNNTNRSNNSSRTSITVPYNKGLSESFKNIGKKFGIQVHFKSGRTIKEELVAPKDKDHITKKSGVIYRFKCERL